MFYFKKQLKQATRVHLCLKNSKMYDSYVIRYLKHPKTISKPTSLLLIHVFRNKLYYLNETSFIKPNQSNAKKGDELKITNKTDFEDKFVLNYIAIYKIGATILIRVVSKLFDGFANCISLKLDLKNETSHNIMSSFRRFERFSVFIIQRVNLNHIIKCLFKINL